MSHDCVTMTIVTLYDLYDYYISHYIITLSKSKIKRNEKNKIKSSLVLTTLTVMDS